MFRRIRIELKATAKEQLLKDDLDSELHIEWLTRTDARSAVKVSNGVAYCTVSIYRSWSGSKIDPVEEVKHVGSELRFEPLANRYVLEDREIYTCIIWTVKFVTSQIPGT